MGSAESQLAAAGVCPGDSQRDEESPQFLTPDLLERTWLDLDPSPDLDMPWEKGIWGSIFCNKPFCVSPQQKWKRLACPADLQLEQLEKPAKVPRRVLVADHWRANRCQHRCNLLERRPRGQDGCCSEKVV